MESSTTLQGFTHAFILTMTVTIISEIGDKTFFISAIMAMKYSRLVVYAGTMSALAIMTVISVLFGWLAKSVPREIVFYASTALFIIFGVMMLWEGCRMSRRASEQAIEEAQVELRRLDEHGLATTSDARLEVATTSNVHTGMAIISESQTGMATTPDNKMKAIVVEKKKIAKGKDNPNDSVTDPRMMNTIPESGCHRRLKHFKRVFWIFLHTFVMIFLAEWGDRSQLTLIVIAAREDVYGVMLGGVVGHSLISGLAVTGGRFVAKMISLKTVTIIGGVVFIVFAFSALSFKYGLKPFLESEIPTNSRTFILPAQF